MQQSAVCQILPSQSLDSLIRAVMTLLKYKSVVIGNNDATALETNE